MSHPSFNEFQKQLRNRGIDIQVAYMMTVMYEQMMEMAKQVDECATLMETMANGMEKLLLMSQEDKKKVLELQKRIKGGDDGIHVQSVANDPNDLN